MSERDEGYIKFNIDWQKTPQLKLDLSGDLIIFRQKLYGKDWIGVYPDGIGFGNISQRNNDDTFIISASATGNVKNLTGAHFAKVTDFDVKNNKVFCEGPMKASSESMSHAIVYQTMPEINVVLHIHDMDIWQKMLFKYPTTPKEVPYGTPQMANSIRDLLEETNWKETPNIIIMAGHDEGIIAFGKDMDEAFGYLEELNSL